MCSGSGARGSLGDGVGGGVTGHGGGQHTGLTEHSDEHTRDPLSPEISGAGMQAPHGRAPQTHACNPRALGGGGSPVVGQPLGPFQERASAPGVVLRTDGGFHCSPFNFPNAHKPLFLIFCSFSGVYHKPIGMSFLVFHSFSLSENRSFAHHQAWSSRFFGDGWQWF